MGVAIPENEAENKFMGYGGKQGARALTLQCTVFAGEECRISTVQRLGWDLCVQKGL